MKMTFYLCNLTLGLLSFFFGVYDGCDFHFLGPSKPPSGYLLIDSMIY